MFRVVIPARYAAMRLPGKPLLPIAGRPLLQWVWENVQRSGAAQTVVAVDDARICSAALGFGAECVMTGTHHASGTDRIAEVARMCAWPPDDVVVNVQGDEPLIPPGLIADLAELLESQPRAQVASAVAPIRSLQEFLDPNCVKALRGVTGEALYFSRAPVPWPRDAMSDGRPASYQGAWRHIGIYAYRVRSLLQFSAWAPTALELTEKLEQLRALEHGMSLHLLTLEEAPPSGVDTLEDLQRVREVLEGAPSAR